MQINAIIGVSCTKLGGHGRMTDYVENMDFNQKIGFYAEITVPGLFSVKYIPVDIMFTPEYEGRYEYNYSDRKDQMSCSTPVQVSAPLWDAALNFAVDHVTKTSPYSISELKSMFMASRAKWTRDFADWAAPFRAQGKTVSVMANGAPKRRLSGNVADAFQVCDARFSVVLDITETGVRVVSSEKVA